MRKTRLGMRVKKSRPVRKLYFWFTEFYVGGKTNSPTMEEEDYKYLRDLYDKDIQELENLIHRDLNFWKLPF